MTVRPVVLDTNVLVAAGFRPESASGRIVRAVRSGELRMVWSEATRRETEQILRKIPPLRHEPLIDLFRSDDRYRGELEPERFASVPDPEDRKFAALASAAGAVLITSDEPLLAAVHAGDFEAVTPGDFWRRWSRDESGEAG